MGKKKDKKRLNEVQENKFDIIDAYIRGDIPLSKVDGSEEKKKDTIDLLNDELKNQLNDKGLNGIFNEDNIDFDLDDDDILKNIDFDDDDDDEDYGCECDCGTHTHDDKEETAMSMVGEFIYTKIAIFLQDSISKHSIDQLKDKDILRKLSEELVMTEDFLEMIMNLMFLQVPYTIIEHFENQGDFMEEFDNTFNENDDDKDGGDDFSHLLDDTEPSDEDSKEFHIDVEEEVIKINNEYLYDENQLKVHVPPKAFDIYDNSVADDVVKLSLSTVEILVKYLETKYNKTPFINADSEDKISGLFIQLIETNKLKSFLVDILLPLNSGLVDNDENANVVNAFIDKYYPDVVNEDEKPSSKDATPLVVEVK